MEEATTSAATPETTSVPTETSAPTTETAGTERPETDQGSSDSVDFDISQVPENIRSEVEKYGKQLDKRWKADFTRKTQEFSAREKAQNAEAQKALQRARELEAILADPRKVDAYRQLTQQPQPEQPQFETVEDLVTHAKTIAGHEARQAAAQELQAFQAKSRWSSAVASIEERAAKETHPEIAKLAVEIAMVNPEVRSLYRGDNEADVMAKAYDMALKRIQPFVDTVKKKALTTVETKKTSATAVPSKTVTTEGARKLTTDEIIARVNSKVPR